VKSCQEVIPSPDVLTQHSIRQAADGRQAADAATHPTLAVHGTRVLGLEGGKQ
jgi:hypothetical protein